MHMTLRSKAILLAVVAVLAASVARTIEATRSEVEGFRDGVIGMPAAAAQWEMLPAPPTGRRYASHVALEGSGRTLFLATTSGRGKRELLQIWRFRGGQWSGPLGGRSWKVSPDVDVHLASSSLGLCIDPTGTDGFIRVECFERGRWREVGAPYRAGVRPSQAAGFVVLRDRTYLVIGTTDRGTLLPGGVGLAQRTSHRLYLERAGGWKPVSPDVDASPGGSQRPFPAVHHNQPCVAFTDLPDAHESNTKPSTAVATRCFTGTAWTQLGSKIDTPNARAVDVDGFASSDAGTVVGTDVFIANGDSIDVFWSVHQLSGREWKPFDIAVRDAKWQSQGSLYTVGDAFWSFQFDQQALPSGYRARFWVRAASASSGRSTTVGGAPVLAPTTLYGPPAYDLATLGSFVYVAFSMPESASKTQGIVVRRVAVGG